MGNCPIRIVVTIIVYDVENMLRLFTKGSGCVELGRRPINVTDIWCSFVHLWSIFARFEIELYIILLIAFLHFPVAILHLEIIIDTSVTIIISVLIFRNYH